MSIIHVTDCFLPRLGGIEVQVAGLAAEQARSGEDVHVVTATRNASPGERYSVRRIAVRLPWDVPVHPRAGSHLDRVIASLSPSLVHVHVGAISPFAWSGVRSAARVGLPTVVVVHSMWDPVVQWCYRALDRLASWSAAPVAVAAVSRAAAGRVRAVVPGLPVGVVPNGIVPSAWRGIPRQRRDDAVHVVSVGRLAARKEPMALLRALRAVSADVPLRATLAGAGPEMAVLRRYVERHGMGWVSLPGRLDRQGVAHLLAGADVFVNPASQEAFGLAALEARTAGVPVVARPGTGVADFVRDGVEGVLTHDLAAGITRLVNDREERLRIAAHNRTTEPTHCTWPRVLEALRSCAARV